MTSRVTASGDDSTTPVDERPAVDLKRRIAAPVAVLVAAIGLILLTAMLLVRTRAGQRFDLWAMNLIGARWRDRVHLMDGLDATIPASPLTMGLVMVGLVLIALTRRRTAAAVGIVVLLAGANLSTQLVKHHLLTRPDYGFGTDNTFPSGHVTAIMSLALAAVLATPAVWRTTVSFLGTIAVTLVASATVATNWHRPSDTLGAVAVAIAWGAAAVLAVILVSAHRPDMRTVRLLTPAKVDQPRPTSRPTSRPPTSQIVRPAMVQLSAVAVAAGVLLLFGVRPAPGHSFILAALLVAAIGAGVAACFVAFVWLVTPHVD